MVRGVFVCLFVFTESVGSCIYPVLVSILLYLYKKNLNLFPMVGITNSHCKDGKSEATRSNLPKVIHLLKNRAMIFVH